MNLELIWFYLKCQAIRGFRRLLIDRFTFIDVLMIPGSIIIAGFFNPESLFSTAIIAFAFYIGWIIVEVFLQFYLKVDRFNSRSSTEEIDGPRY